KDRYTMRADDRKRKMTQFVVNKILHDVVIVLAPVLSFTSEEAYGYFKGNRKESVFLEEFPVSVFSDSDREFLDKWDDLLTVREAVQKLLENLRSQKLIGHPLDASVDIYWENMSVLDEEFDSLESIFIVSEVKKVFSAEGLEKPVEELGFWIAVREAAGEKCPRCWKKRELKNYSEEIQGICETCYEAVK
ncbi:MAG TPA: class I tRNA ligase family protein, partial [bacterium]|nr:class I tRNA ligase family protein [bacterium]